MVKRRNSPFPSHDRTAAIRVPIDCTPTLLKPGRITKPRKPKTDSDKLWSPENPSGGFIH
jgi:hypothetical protein